MSDAYEQAKRDLVGAVPILDVEGERFVLHGRLTTLDVSELARSAGLDSQSTEGAAILADTFRAAFGDHKPDGAAEYARFRRHLRTVADPDKAQLAALNRCVEAFSGFPTAQPSPSPSEAQSTTGGSRDAGWQPDAPALDESRVVVNLGRRAS